MANAIREIARYMGDLPPNSYFANQNAIGATLLRSCSYSALNTQDGAALELRDAQDTGSQQRSFAVALQRGDTKTVRAIYAGDDKAFLEYLDTFDKTSETAKRVQKAIVDRFGENNEASHADHSLFLQKIGRDRRKRGKKGRHEKHRKQPRGNGSTKSILSS